MKLKRVAQTVERFVLSLSLTRHINLDALSPEPSVFLPNTRSEFLFHASILSHVGDDESLNPPPLSLYPRVTLCRPERIFWQSSSVVVQVVACFR